jgi:hypothetical protein
VSPSLTRDRGKLSASGHGPWLTKRNEIFGPVLTVVHADTLDDAIAIINKNK